LHGLHLALELSSGVACVLLLSLVVSGKYLTILWNSSLTVNSAPVTTTVLWSFCCAVQY